MLDHPAGPPRKPDFPTTRWSRVIAAAGADLPDAAGALAELCAGYWYPIYAFIRSRGYDPEAALDLTQGYFARLLERRPLAAADRQRGRFRNFLRADCGHFLAHCREHDDAIRRGGGHLRLSIDVRDAEGRYLIEPTDGRTPERIFDRAWALALLEAVLLSLRRDYEGSGRWATFEALKCVLTDGRLPASQADLARRLGTSEAAVQVAVSSLRRRYRETLRASIAATVADEAEVEDELRDLFAAMGPLDGVRAKSGRRVYGQSADPVHEE